jgi:hypothetical protein
MMECVALYVEELHLGCLDSDAIFVCLLVERARITIHLSLRVSLGRPGVPKTPELDFLFHCSPNPVYGGTDLSHPAPPKPMR